MWWVQPLLAALQAQPMVGSTSDSIGWKPYCPQDQIRKKYYSRYSRDAQKRLGTALVTAFERALSKLPAMAAANLRLILVNLTPLTGNSRWPPPLGSN